MTRHPAHDIYTYLGAHPAEQGFTFRATLGTCYSSRMR